MTSKTQELKRRWQVVRFQFSLSTRDSFSQSSLSASNYLGAHTTASANTNLSPLSRFAIFLLWAWLLSYLWNNVLSHSVMSDCDPVDCSPLGSSVHENFPGKNTGVGCHFLLQAICEIIAWVYRVKQHLILSWSYLQYKDNLINGEWVSNSSVHYSHLEGLLNNSLLDLIPEFLINWFCGRNRICMSNKSPGWGCFCFQNHLLYYSNLGWMMILAVPPPPCFSLIKGKGKSISVHTDNKTVTFKMLYNWLQLTSVLTPDLRTTLNYWSKEGSWLLTTEAKCCQLGRMPGLVPF